MTGLSWQQIVSIVGIGFVLVLMALVFGLCRVASDADDALEEMQRDLYP